MVVFVASHSNFCLCEVCEFSCEYRFGMPSSIIVQHARHCRDIPVEKFYFPLLGNMHFIHHMSCSFHLSTVISDPISTDGVRLGLEFYHNTLSSNHGAW